MNKIKFFSFQKLLSSVLIGFLIYACDDPFAYRAPEEYSYMLFLSLGQRTIKEETGRFATSFTETIKYSSLSDIQGESDKFKEETNNYIFSTHVVGNDWAVNIAFPKTDGLKMYLGLIRSFKDKEKKISFYESLCVSKKRNKIIPSELIRHIKIDKDGFPLCPNGYSNRQSDLVS